MALVGVVIEINGANLRNDHIYLRDAAFLFSSTVIGGGNKSDLADESLTVEFQPGRTVETDIAGDKMIFRERSAVKDFFERSGAVEGDRVILQAIGPRKIRVTLASKH